MRPIDAHDLMERLYDANPKGRVELAELIETEPTVDAVEVVRCKDCKFFRRYGFRLEYAECIKFDFYDTTEDGFCSYGERREDGAERK